MKNYYEILEVSETASKEVIEKVYKVLAKKYHPDVNPEDIKEAEEKFKEISEAYEVLSDDTKRKAYDIELLSERDSSKAYVEQPVRNEVDEPQKQPEPHYKVVSRPQTYSTNRNNTIDEKYKKAQEEYYEAMQEYQIQKAYNDAYIEALKSMGVEVVYKKTFKDYLKIFGVILIIIRCNMGTMAYPTDTN